MIRKFDEGRERERERETHWRRVNRVKQGELRVRKDGSVITPK